MKHYDIIISGAGIAGATLANKLARSKFISSSAKSILLLDKTTPNFKNLSSNPNHWDLRTVALSPGNVQYLKETENQDIWRSLERIANGKISKAQQMHVYDAGSPKSNGITFDNPNTTIVENMALNKAVLESLPGEVDFKKNYEIEVVNGPSEVKYDESIQNTPLIEINEGEFSTNLLIGADGANSQIKKLFNFKKIWEHNYNTRATCAQLKLPEGVSHNNTAWQRFLPYGPIALLPLTEGYFNLVWSAEKEMALRLAELSDEKFIEEVNFQLQADLKYLNSEEHFPASVFGHLPSSTGSESPLRPPVIESLAEGSKRGSFPLIASASTVTKPRVVLIGDAGHRVHPLAGQGLNMGLRDVQHLEEAILHGWYRGADIGTDTDVLNKFNFNQAVDNIPVGIGVHAIEKIFKTDLPPVVAARNIGMSLIDNLGPVKNILADLARK